MQFRVVWGLIPCEAFLLVTEYLGYAIVGTMWLSRQPITCHVCCTCSGLQCACLSIGQVADLAFISGFIHQDTWTRQPSTCMCFIASMRTHMPRARGSVVINAHHMWISARINQVLHPLDTIAPISNRVCEYIVFFFFFFFPPILSFLLS